MVPDLLRHRNGRPPMTIPLVTAPPAAAGGRAGGHLARPRDHPGRDRRSLRADRPGVVAARLPVDHPRAPRGCIRCRSPSASCRRCRRWSSPMTTTTIWTWPTVRHAGRHPDRAVRRARSASAPTCAVGVSPRTGSSSWTGTEHHGRRHRDRCTPGRHFSGRGLRRNTTLWSSWALLGPRHRVFFGGDTGYTDRVRRDRPPVGAVRRDHPADRRVRRPLAGHPPQPGGGGGRAPRPGRRADGADPLGDLRPGAALRGPSRCSGCGRPARTLASPHRGRANASTRTPPLLRMAGGAPRTDDRRRPVRSPSVPFTTR